MIRVGIVCGGISAEHEISCISAGGILSAIDRSKFEPVLIGITKSGKWVLPPQSFKLEIENGELPEISENLPQTSLSQIEVDILFPTLHGTYGEDGGFQKDAQAAGIKYVGSGVLASQNGMDKAAAKRIFANHGLKTAPGIVVSKEVWRNTPEKIIDQGLALGLPVFVKPSNSGSSRGTSKVKTETELSTAIDFAFEYDEKVLIETAINGREIECAVFERDGVLEASPLGEIKIMGSHEFYDFEAKYLDGATQLIIPAEVPATDAKLIQDAAITAFRALDCAGLARVDFFYVDGSIIINEINTMPGFTSTSMFPRMCQAAGISYKELITLLIEGALKKRN